MKILHLLHSLRGGGIQNLLLSLAPEQAKQGNDLTVVVIDEYDSEYCLHLEAILISKNVKVVRLNKTRGNKLSLIKAIYKLSKTIKSFRPDIINSHAEISHFYCAIATIFTNIPHVITVHNAPEEWNSILKLLCKNKPLIFCSQSAYDLRQQESNLMVVINNGISKEIIHSNEIADLRMEFGLSASARIIILVGSLRPQKNYPFLKEIVAELKEENIHFFVCGGGRVADGEIDSRDFVKYETIHFLGLRQDVSAIENGADLFLSCSTYEGLPIAVLEAFFNGIPCVLSPIEQHLQISDIPECWTPELFDAFSFSKTIKVALQTNKSHTEIYNERKSFLAQYSIEEASKKYVSFYKKVLIP
jgi:glycosyltransferase involved in cell wall biosynthesis